MYAQFLEASPPVSPTFATSKSLVHDEASSTEEECALELELKPLASSLMYEFLGPNSTYFVIVNVSVNASQVDSLLRMLIVHDKAMVILLMTLKEFTLL